MRPVAKLIAWGVLMVVWGLPPAQGPIGVAHAETILNVEFHQITSSNEFEYIPRLGNDGVSDIVVYMSRERVETGALGPSRIWYQRLSGGEKIGAPVLVSDLTTSDYLPDTSGDYIVFISENELDEIGAQVKVFQISTGEVWMIGEAGNIRNTRINGSNVVWVEGEELVPHTAKLYDLSWLGTDTLAEIIAGPVPGAYDIDIGTDFAAWTECVQEDDNTGFDIVAFDFATRSNIPITDTLSVSERRVAVSGPWFTWLVSDLSVEPDFPPRIEAMNWETGDFRVITEDDTRYLWLISIDGDLIAWGSSPVSGGPIDVFVHRLSTEETFRITSFPPGEGTYGLPHVLKNSVAFTQDNPEGIYSNWNIWIANLSFETQTTEEAIEETIVDATEVISSIDPGAFKNENMQQTILNKMDSVTDLIESGYIDEAISKLENDILKKTDGCVNSGEPDRNDWIEDCANQTELYSLVQELIALLQDL